MDFATEVTDAPAIFHEFVGLATAGVAMGNKYCLPFGSTKIYPNFWLVLVAPSSLYHKSTALNIGQKAIKDVDKSCIYPAEFSHEKLIAILEEKPVGAFFIDEFTTLLGMLDKTYMASTKPFLTTLFDCPGLYERKTKQGSITIESPSVSIFSATTKDWLLQKIGEDDIQAGFVPRFLLIWANTKDRHDAIPRLPDMDKQANMLIELQRLNNPCKLQEKMRTFSLSREAEVLITSWYEDNIVNNDNHKHDAFLQRTQIYLLKISMIIEAMKSDSIIISGESIEKASGLICKATDSLKTLYDMEFAFTPFEKSLKKVNRYIVEHDNISKSQLLRKTNLGASELDKIIETLKQSEKISVVSIGIGNRKKTLFKSQQHGN